MLRQIGTLLTCGLRRHSRQRLAATAAAGSPPASCSTSNSFCCLPAAPRYRFPFSSCSGAASFSTYLEKRAAQAEELAKLPELVQRDRLLAELEGTIPVPDSVAPLTAHAHLSPTAAESPAHLSPEQLDACLTAGLLTFALHLESRVSSALGEGFYTIGPCGEEALSAVGLALRADDAVALHYRHLATSLSRGVSYAGKSVRELALDRARGYTVSSRDPVGGGAHCLLGGGPQDFPVTSTLASQAPPAVGRALGGRLAHLLGGSAADACGFPADFVSYVSVGDGSVNNAHFLAAINLAEYTRHRGYKCPTVFGVSDNDRCISLRGHGWLDKFLAQRVGGMPVFRCDGNNAHAVFGATRDAAAFARSRGAPAAVVFEGVARRFGHAATDRQIAYLDAGEIQEAQEFSAIAAMCARAERDGVATLAESARRFREILDTVTECFAEAAAEPKLQSRQALLDRTSAPLAPLQNGVEVKDAAPARVGCEAFFARPAALKLAQKEDKSQRPQVMRKHMTAVLDEALADDPRVVYIGEDVEHGGYYLVTQGLKDKFPYRVADFPPDETGLVGAAIGYAQAGLVPVCEIPYAKYLDCGGDMFFEAAVMHWLSNGASPNGMVIRLQGFDRGVFGGNFHTHNMLHTPPGLDVVCFSNGEDYVRGMRHALRQAKAGRVVMTVDSTALLNERHLGDGGDDAWMRPFPAAGEEMGFDEVRVYDMLGGGEWGEEEKEELAAAKAMTVPELKNALRAEGKVVGGKKGELVRRLVYGEGAGPVRVGIVTYGNGVRTSMRYAVGCREPVQAESGGRRVELSVVDSPCLSQTPAQLRTALRELDAVVFADVCKAGPQFPLAGMVANLQASGDLPRHWKAIGAVNTYNPLGNTSTFLSESDVGEAVEAVVRGAVADE